MQDFKTEIRFYFINNKIDILRSLQWPHRQDKIVVYFTVYFCDCSFGEIPIVPQLFGSFGLFSPCLIEDLFAHKDFKRALFPKEYKLVDENEIVMRDDFSPCCLHALPLAALPVT